MAASKPLFSLTSLPGWTPLPADSAPRASKRVEARKLTTAQPPPESRGSRDRPSTDASWVKTDEDVAAYFEQHGSAGVEFFYAIRRQAAGDSSSSSQQAGGDSGSGGGDAWDAAADEFYLQVVPQERVQLAKSYYIISQRTVVCINHCEPTEAVPLAEWLRHKQAFLSLRRLTFFGSHALAKCFSFWRAAAVRQLHRRRRAELSQRLLLVCPAFQAALLEADGLLERVRGVRAAGVQPGRRYSAADWEEQQGAWRARHAQPEIEAAAGALAQLAEGVCARVEARADDMVATVRPDELADRIGVDLQAATRKAASRSMQDIKADKLARAAAYRSALRDRQQLPRLLRMLDLRLAGALASGAAATVGEAAVALRVAAPGLLQRQAAAMPEAGVDDEDDAVASSFAVGPATASDTSSGSLFLCHISLAADGSVVFSPSEAEWAAALQGEVVASSLRLAASQPTLLSLPAFERYQQQLVADERAAADASADGDHSAGGAEQAGTAEGGSTGSPEPQPPELLPAASRQASATPRAAHDRATAQQLAQGDAVFTAGAADLQALLAASFAEAQRATQGYRRFAEVQRFGAEFDAEAWAEQQRAALDLAGAEALMRRLAAWRADLEGMPLSAAAGLLHLDASGLQAELAPVVGSAQDRVSALLLGLAGARCRALLAEAAVWLEVAAARPPELDAFLAWAGEAARLRGALQGQLAAAASVDAALELVAAFAGKLPTADACKKDDLREAAARLPAALDEAAAWAAGQRAEHAAAVAAQLRGLAEEGVLLESELQVGSYVDAGACPSEVLADLDLQQSRLAGLAAQAEELAGLQRELQRLAGLPTAWAAPAEEQTGEGGAAAARAADGATAVDGAAAEGPPGGVPWELKDAEAALQRCSQLWGLVAEAEALRDGQASQAGGGQDGEDGEAPAAPEHGTGEAGRVGRVQEMLGRLAALREGGGAPPSAVWMRANTALLAYSGAIA